MRNLKRQSACLHGFPGRNDKEEGKRRGKGVNGERREAVRQLESEQDQKKQQEELKQSGEKVNECSRLVSEWEREARIDGQAEEEIKTKKEDFKQRIKSLDARRKKAQKEIRERNELLPSSSAQAEGSTSPSTSDHPNSAQRHQQLNTNQLVEHGRGEMREAEKGIERSKRVVNETVEVGQKTAETLRGQTEQMQRIEEGLDRVRFDLNRARRIVRDISKSIATDKCIMTLLCLIVCAVIVIIALEVSGVGGSGISIPGR